MAPLHGMEAGGHKDQFAGTSEDLLWSITRTNIGTSMSEGPFVTQGRPQSWSTPAA